VLARFPRGRQGRDELRLQRSVHGELELRHAWRDLAGTWHEGRGVRLYAREVGPLGAALEEVLGAKPRPGRPLRCQPVEMPGAGGEA
jgi:hypothetical protein